MKEYITDKIHFVNCDCMEYMKQFPDKYFKKAVERIERETAQMNIFDFEEIEK